MNHRQSKRGSPRYTVFLPVRNGGEHFRLCVESVLAQTHRDFRLCVLDNASSDGTLEWIIAQDDPRIEVQPAQEPLGIEANWARILDMPKTEFMTIIGHDDVFDPHYLQSMNDLIEANPGAALFQAHFRLIDEAGTLIRNCMPMPATETGADFLRSRLRFRRDSFGTGYMFRSTDYERVGGIPPFNKLMLADDALWLSLMRYGPKATAARISFSYRVHAASTSYAPAWQVLLGAVDSYLVLLRDMATTHCDIARIARKSLLPYVVFWLQWSRFVAPMVVNEEPEFDAAIHRLTSRLRDLGVGTSEKELAATVHRRVFGATARVRWLGSRVIIRLGRLRHSLNH